MYVTSDKLYVSKSHLYSKTYTMPIYHSDQMLHKRSVGHVSMCEYIWFKNQMFPLRQSWLCMCLCVNVCVCAMQKNDWFHWDSTGGLLSWWFMCLLLPFPHPALRMQSTGRLQLFRELSQCVCVCFSLCVCSYPWLKFWCNIVPWAVRTMFSNPGSSSPAHWKTSYQRTALTLLYVQGRMWPRMSISISVFIQHAYHNMKGFLYASQYPCTVDICPGYAQILLMCFCLVSLKKGSLATFLKNLYSHLLALTVELIIK